MNILINDSLSRSYFGQQPYDPAIMIILDELELTIDEFRSSTQLRKLLTDIVTMLLNEKKILPSRGSHFITIRLEAMTTLLINQLCVPHLFDVVGMSKKLGHMLTGFWSGKSDEVDGMHSSVLGRAKGVLVEAFSLIKLNEESLVNPTGDVNNIDERLSYLLINLLDFQTSAILPHAVTLRQYGFVALETLTCYVLSVTAVCEVVRESVKRVIHQMIDLLSEEEPTHIGGPSQREVDTTFKGNCARLKHELMGYFRWLRANAEQLIRDSRKDEIIMSVNANLRIALRSESYCSPSEAVKVFHDRYQSQLTNLRIPLQSYTKGDISQARKDMIRDRVSVNKVLYSSNSIDGLHLPLSTLKCRTASDAVKEEIKKVLVFSLAVDRVELFEETIHSEESSVKSYSTASDTVSLTRAERDRSLSISSQRKNSISSAGNAPTTIYTAGQMPGPLPACESSTLEKKTSDVSHPPENDAPLGLMRRSSIGTPFCDETEAFLRKQSNNSSLTTCLSSPNVSLRATVSFQGIPEPPSLLPSFFPSSSPSTNNLFFYLPEQLQSNEYFYADILSVLHAYTLLAASRTFAGGDAFIILNDLYGGEGLTLCPFKIDHGRSRAGSHSLPCSPARPGKQSTNTPQTHSLPNSTASSLKKNEEANDIVIAIKSEGIKVTVKERYKLFANVDLEDCCDPANLQPLMCFECTTTTLIILSTDAISKVDLDLQNISSSTGFQQHEKAYRLYQILLTKPQELCLRAVSIEPFIW